MPYWQHTGKPTTATSTPHITRPRRAPNPYASLLQMPIPCWQHTYNPQQPQAQQLPQQGCEELLITTPQTAKAHAVLAAHCQDYNGHKQNNNHNKAAKSFSSRRPTAPYGTIISCNTRHPQTKGERLSTRRRRARASDNSAPADAGRDRRHPQMQGHSAKRPSTSPADAGP